jgi:FdhD protein
MKNPSDAEGIEQLSLCRFDGRRLSGAAVDVVREMLLEVFVDGCLVVTIACAGIHLRELAAGFARQEGLIESAGDILEMTFTSDRVDIGTRGGRGRAPSIATGKTIGSSGSRGSRSFQAEGKKRVALQECPKLDAETVLRLTDALLEATVIHERTRGTHCSALAGPQGILAAREDIGRHNTIDMLCGWALLEGVDLADKILLTTGRVSSEIVSKAWRMGVPVIVSHSAATSRAIMMAESLGIVIIGYVRGGTFTVYAGSEAINA